MIERLESAKIAIDWDWEKIPPDVQVHLKWLIEQAERVKYLQNREKEIIKINQHELKYRAKVETQNIELEQQNKRYREIEEKIKTIIGKEYDDVLYTKKEALLDINKALEESE